MRIRIASLLLFVAACGGVRVTGSPLPRKNPAYLRPALGTFPRKLTGDVRVAASSSLLDDLRARRLESARLAWDFCIDPSGQVTDVSLAVPSDLPASTAAPYAALIRTWTFSPLVVDGAAVPEMLCSAATFKQRVDADGADGVLSERWYAPPRAGKGGERVAGESEIHLPKDLLASLATLKMRTVPLLFEVCFDETGTVDRVEPLGDVNPPPAVRDFLGGELRRWHYSPFMLAGRPTGACEVKLFRYIID